MHVGTGWGNFMMMVLWCIVCYEAWGNVKFLCPGTPPMDRTMLIFTMNEAQHLLGRAANFWIGVIDRMAVGVNCHIFNHDCSKQSCQPTQIHRGGSRPVQWSSKKTDLTYKPWRLTLPTIYTWNRQKSAIFASWTVWDNSIVQRCFRISISCQPRLE